MVINVLIEAVDDHGEFNDIVFQRGSSRADKINICDTKMNSLIEISLRDFKNAAKSLTVPMFDTTTRGEKTMSDEPRNDEEERDDEDAGEEDDGAGEEGDDGAGEEEPKSD